MALNPRIKSIIFITAGLLIFIISAVAYAIFNHKTNYEYAVLVDSGNPNVTISLYRWSNDRLNRTGLAELAETCISSDLTEHLTNSSDLSNVFQPCLSRVIGSLDKDDQTSSTSQLFFTISGPLMLLNSSTATVQQQVTKLIQSAHEYLTNSTKLSVQPIQMINERTGSIFPWIAANSIEARNSHQSGKPSTAIKHNGILEVSYLGSSISYEVNTSTPLKPEQVQSLVNVTLFGTNHTLYGKHYSCLSSDKGRLRYVARLIEGSSETILGDPCLPIGVNQTINSRDLSSSYDPCLDSRESNPNENKEHTLVGKGDGSSCSKLIQDLLTDKSKCNNPSNPNPTCYSPPVLDRSGSIVFTAIGDLLYPVTILKLTHPGNHTIESTDYLNQSLTLCSLTRDELLTTSSGKLAPTSLCFQLLYNYHTIETVFGLINGNWSSIVFDPSLRGDSSLNWPTGFMVNATSSIPILTAPKPWFNGFFFLIIASIALIYLVIGAYYLAASLKTQRVPNKEIYEPIQQQPQP